MTDTPAHPKTQGFESDRHALYAGWILGLAMKHKVQLQPEVDEDGNYTPNLFLFLPGVKLTFVVPPPPADWKFE